VRYIVYGAGAVGGAMGGRLVEAGRDVVLIARGPHLDAMVSDGLTMLTPDGAVTVAVSAVGDPADAKPGPGDVVVMAMKSQHTIAALERLAAVADPGIAVVCAQNGVANEGLALRWFAQVHACCVMVPATHLEPGVVEIPTGSVTGLLELGRYPSGIDAVDEQMAVDLEAATFDVRISETTMRWKYTKLLSNIGNAINAACEAGPESAALHGRAREEAIACYRAAGIAWASEEEDRERRKAMPPLRPIEGRRRPGGSSWQSLARGTGNVEADWLNGEIVVLGRLHGVPTPINEALRRAVNRMAREGQQPGTMTVDELLKG